MGSEPNESLFARWRRRRDEKKKARKQPETFGLLVKENIEAFLFAVVLVVIVRHFSLTPFRIPSSSMEPTLLGNDQHNDRLFVNRWAYIFSPIRRWDVVVFLYPLNQDKHFIKRLIGLPGERIAIADGDIYIDGKIARKSERAQRSLWLLVNRIRSRDDYLAWQADSKGTRYDEASGEVRIEGGAQPAWFRFGSSPEIRDGGAHRSFSAYSYYPTPGGPPQHLREDNARYVGDVRLACTLTPAAGTRQVLIEIISGDQRYRMELPVGGGAGRFVHDQGPDHGKREQAVRGFALAAGRSHALAYWHVDRRVVLELDGRRFTYDEPPIELERVRFRTERAEIGIGVAGGGAALADVALDRDVYYTNTGILDREGHERPKSFLVPPEHYFMLGDNSASSSDSRLWAIARIKLKDGRVINRELQAGGDREWTAMRDPRDNEYILYRDEYGMVQRVRESEIVSVEALGHPGAKGFDPFVRYLQELRSPVASDPAYQTVHRKLIIGRAFFLFWPLQRVGFIR